MTVPSTRRHRTGSLAPLSNWVLGVLALGHGMADIRLTLGAHRNGLSRLPANGWSSALGHVWGRGGSAIRTGFWRNTIPRFFRTSALRRLQRVFDLSLCIKGKEIVFSAWRALQRQTSPHSRGTLRNGSPIILFDRLRFSAQF